MIFDRFDVVLIPVDGGRKRPALVISGEWFQNHTKHVLLAVISSGISKRWDSDVELQEWKSAKLKSESIVRLRLFTVKGSLAKRIGHIGEGDQVAVEKSLAQSLSGEVMDEEVDDLEESENIESSSDDTLSQHGQKFDGDEANTDD